MNAIRKEIVQFLDENVSTFIQSWRQRVLISDNDIHKEEVINNGKKMFQLVKLRLENALSEGDVRELAYKVASERVEANINIGDLVFNVNEGRKEINNWIISSGFPYDKLIQILEEINTIFDQFSYYTVKKYTEIKEEQLEEKTLFIDQTHKERLTILGQMSSSFVHEFRNPLTTVIGFTKLINNEYPTIKYIDIIEHELHQLNSRVTQFLHVSKKELINGDKFEVSLKKLFDDLLNFIYPSIVDGDVKVTKNIHSDISVFANQEELRQVFLNILLNSIDALQYVRHTKIMNIDCNTSDGKAEITISNNGPVIPKEIIAVIFEPFFTTKELGTGIGLYICKKIINKHEGEISCVSDEKLTTFSIKLPLFIKKGKCAIS
ncbi:histidine kinase N-terminal domain-containing protein [Cytobacillus sp. IB215665]|uniref:histidine kinase N-terminal domain-containing protein n=1 Tax=Cytobacillus sp. IB215665 TaxID=3097357 RepID=UPI002A0C5839|nr:histidine kinase N-terminal domain-containing protein [Cytobacillus sp. IB215665]MDX8366291.1 histidine kinase N-terminal domain-containing protein [Cytobacillus sp. IB215665]